MHGFHTIFLEQLRFAFRGSQWTIWHQWIIVLGVQGNLNWMPGYDVCSKVKGLNIGMSLNLHPFIFLFYLFISIITYEGWSKSSDVYLAALSRDIFERHTMQHSKELAFIFIMMLVFSRCTVSFNTVITAHSIWPTPYTTGLFSCYRIIIIFESESFKIIYSNNENWVNYFYLSRNFQY